MDERVPMTSRVPTNLSISAVRAATSTGSSSRGNTHSKVRPGNKPSSFDPALTPRCMTSKLPAEERCNPGCEIVGVLEEQAVASLEELDGDPRGVRRDAFRVPSKPKSVGGHQLRVGPRIWLSSRHHENLTPQLRIQSEHVERFCVSEDLTAEARWGRAQVRDAVRSTEGP